MYIGKSDKVISFENAKLLKNNGFEERCIAYYNIAGELAVSINPSGYDHNALQGYFSAPFREDVLEWLRKNHNIFVEFTIIEEEELKGYGDDEKYNWRVCRDSDGGYCGVYGRAKTPTQAVENSINSILKNFTTFSKWANDGIQRI